MQFDDHQESALTQILSVEMREEISVVIDETFGDFCVKFEDDTTLKFSMASLAAAISSGVLKRHI